MKGIYSLAIASLLALFLLSGCMGDEGDPDPMQIAYVSIYHASPDTEELDIYIGDYTAPLNNTPFGFGDYTGYISVHPGNWNFKFTQAGTGTNTILDTAVAISNYKNYTIFVADSLNSIEALVLTDSADTPATGKAMIRFVHLSPDTQGVKVMADEEIVFENTAFKEGTVFKEVDAGTFTFNFVSGDTEEILLSTPGTELKSGEYYTMLLKGYSTPPAENTNELSSDIYKN